MSGVLVLIYLARKQLLHKQVRSQMINSGPNTKIIKQGNIQNIITAKARPKRQPFL